MYKFKDNQLSLTDFGAAVGLKLNPENHLIKMIIAKAQALKAEEPKKDDDDDDAEQQRYDDHERHLRSPS
jgi:hypothetical protein